MRAMLAPGATAILRLRMRTIQSGVRRVWRNPAEVYVALSDICAKRRLQASMPLLLERACYGDPGEIMRGLRHCLEAIVSPDWACLADICLDLAGSPRKGTRLWAINQLATLEDHRAKSLFERAIETEPSWISEAAAGGLERLARGKCRLDLKLDWQCRLLAHLRRLLRCSGSVSFRKCLRPAPGYRSSRPAV
jgi:hypothetical protein